MRRLKPIQIGSGEPYSGDLTRWYLANNYTYGPIAAEVTDGSEVVSLSDIAYDNGKWSLIIAGRKVGMAMITITGTTPDDEDATRKFSFPIEVKDKARLRTGQTTYLYDYR